MEIAEIRKFMQMLLIRVGKICRKQVLPKENSPQEISPNRRKAVYTEGAGPVCKCTGQCTVEGSVQGGG